MTKLRDAFDAMWRESGSPLASSEIYWRYFQAGAEAALQAEPKAPPGWQVYVQRNVIGADGGLQYPANCEHVPFGPIFDTQDSARLYGASKGWMDIWWHVEQVNRPVTTGEKE